MRNTAHRNRTVSIRHRWRVALVVCSDKPLELAEAARAAGLVAVGALDLDELSTRLAEVERSPVTAPGIAVVVLPPLTRSDEQDFFRRHGRRSNPRLLDRAGNRMQDLLDHECISASALRYAGRHVDLSALDFEPAWYFGPVACPDLARSAEIAGTPLPRGPERDAAWLRRRLGPTLDVGDMPRAVETLVTAVRVLTWTFPEGSRRWWPEPADAASAKSLRQPSASTALHAAALA